MQSGEHHQDSDMCLNVGFEVYVIAQVVKI